MNPGHRDEQSFSFSVKADSMAPCSLAHFGLGTGLWAAADSATKSTRAEPPAAVPPRMWALFPPITALGEHSRSQKHRHTTSLSSALTHGYSHWKREIHAQESASSSLEILLGEDLLMVIIFII